MGHFLFFGWFAEVSEVDHILCYFFHSMDYVLIFPKRGLAKFWEIFFTNSSGRPGCDHSTDRGSMCACVYHTFFMTICYPTSICIHASTIFPSNTQDRGFESRQGARFSGLSMYIAMLFFATSFAL
jgi:hypothetical protein